jgi:DNA-directed RNA polymerase specialized sigma subunit
MPGPYDLPAVPKPTQNTGGPRPPAQPTDAQSLALEPEFQQTYGVWKNSPTPQTNDMMLKSLKPIIDNAVKTYGGPDNPVIRSKAKKIVIDSLPKYDPMNTKLKTYVFNQLQGLKRLSMQQSQILSIPEQVQLDYSNLYKKENELKEELGRDPTTEELADAAMMSPKRINYVRQLQMPASEGAMARPAPGAEGSDYSDPSVMQGGAKELSGWHDFVYTGLGDTDKLIMEHSFGMFGKKVLSNQEIAKKLRISPAAVSIRKNKIQQELDKRDDLNVI